MLNKLLRTNAHLLQAAGGPIAPPRSTLHHAAMVLSTGKAWMHDTLRRTVRTGRRVAATLPGRGSGAGGRSAFQAASQLPALAQWLATHAAPHDFLGPVALDALDKLWTTLPGEPARTDAASQLIRYFTHWPEKARLLCGSNYYLLGGGRSPAVAIIYIAANYVLGRSDRCADVAQRLVATWPNALTRIMQARVLGEAAGPAAERAALEEALRHCDDLVVRLNLIENLIGTDCVEEANQAVAQIRPAVEAALAEEIATVKRNQDVLERAIAAGQFAPEGDEDIYSDEMCRNYWTSYYESFVTRRQREHGDRLLLTKFVDWVRATQHELDVVLDFGALCAQPLYEAALAAPRVQFVGTDRQRFIADMNRQAYPLPNMSFDHGDIVEVMANVAQRPGRKALVHIRTTCTLYPKFVEHLYRKAAELGYEHIYLIENAGFVRSRLQFMRYQTMVEPALVTKHRLNIHNYREQLASAGYELSNLARVRGPGLWRGSDPANYLGSQYEIHARKRAG